MRRILVTGGGGYLGRHLVAFLSETHQVIYTFLHGDPLGTAQGRPVDLRSSEEVAALVGWFRPRVIIHTAGSESSTDSGRVIRLGARNLTEAAARTGARLIHISTDIIFDGRRAPYDETAPPAPLNDYGRAKADAEREVRSGENYVIVRTSLIYGLDVMDRATTHLVEMLRAGRPFTLFTDQRRNPIEVKTLCRALGELALNDYRGVLNVAGRQVVSRARFGLRMLDWWEQAERATLSLGTSDPDRWPRDLELDVSRATDLLSIPLLGFDEVLAGAKAKE